MVTEPLPYESRSPGTLGPGEVLLWEGTPLPGEKPPSVVRVFVVSSIVLIILLAGGTLLGLSGGMTPSLLLILLFASTAGIALWAMRYRKNLDVTFRVTNLRLMRLPASGAATSAEVRRMTGFSFTTERGLTSCKVDGDLMDGEAFAYERASDPALLERLIASLPNRSGRRSTLRRRPKPPPPDSSVTMAITVHRGESTVAATEADDIALASGEVVLWSGQPRPRDPISRAVLGRLKVLAWMLVPTALLLMHRGDFGFRYGHWAPTTFSIIWILLSLNTMTFQPWRSVRRRELTRYYLTNVRAIECYRGRKRTARSAFLDMVTDLTIQEEDDGWGDVTLLGGIFTFQRVADARALHGIAIEAVRNAGVNAPREVPSD